MKSFTKFTFRQRIIVIMSSVLILSCWACDPKSGANAGDYYLDAEPENYQLSTEPENHREIFNQANYQGGQDQGDNKKVEIYDQGLQMPISTIIIPDGWKVIQDIAFDPNTGRPLKYKFDLLGPNGALSRGFVNMNPFGATTGKSFEQAYRELLPVALEGTLQQPSLGNLEPDAEAESTEQFRKMANKLNSQGQQVRAYKVALNGKRDGESYKGEIGFFILTQPTAMGEFGVIQLNGLGIAPASYFETAKAIAKSITKTAVINPAREQRMAQINQRVSQQMAIANQQRSANAAALHQQKMANRQAAFDAHQQRMGTMSEMQDASFNNYMNNLQNSGSYQSGSDYSGQDALVDQIHERSTFNDPWSGQEKSLDGQYDYNYTNGLGDYYRTDDPGFDPNSLQGDWQQIEPNTP